MGLPSFGQMAYLKAGDTQQYMYRLRGKHPAAQLRSVSALGRMEVPSPPPLTTPLSSAASAAWRYTPLTTARRSGGNRRLGRWARKPDPNFYSSPNPDPNPGPD